MFVNIPKRYNPENLSKDEMIELIQAKEEKERLRYIQRFEAEKIDVEQGRWGPFIRFRKKSIKLPTVDGKKMTREQAAELSLEEVKAIVEEQVPGALRLRQRPIRLKLKLSRPPPKRNNQKEKSTGQEEGHRKKIRWQTTRTNPRRTSSASTCRRTSPRASIPT